MRAALPEIGEDEAWKYVVAIWVMASALWTYARPPQALLDACAADERLAATQLDFPAALEDFLTTLAIGLHARG